MFKRIFNRTDTKPAAPEPAPAAGQSGAASKPDNSIMERRKTPRPLPEPEVLEGDGGESDWALWSELTQDQNKK